MRVWNNRWVKSLMNCSKVLELPMRVWNFCIRYRSICRLFVLELPMRVWNQKHQCVVSVSVLCFGVTYEGLKRGIRSMGRNRKGEVLELPMRVWNEDSVRLAATTPLRFGVTYEGLKLVVADPGDNVTVSFGVTYEGLKHKVVLGLSHGLTVLELPMRVWNSTSTWLVA